MAKGTKIILARADIQYIEHTVLREQVSRQAKQRLRSRKRISAGGPLTASDARHKIETKEQKEKEDRARRAAKAIQVDRNKRRAALNAIGVVARRQEKERKDRIKALQAAGQPVPLELTIPIQDPEKDPSPKDLESFEPHPSIAQLVTELYTEEIIIPQIDPELLGLAGSQVVNHSPRSTRDSDIIGQEEEDDDWAADYISFTL
jgi:hypothetical protein